MKVLVTGGAGFIGSHLVKRLVERGDRVTVLDDFSRGKRSSLDDVSGKVKVVKGDIAGPGIGNLAACNDLVYHLAAVSRVMESVRDPVLCLRTNVLGTQAVAEACANAGVGLVFASSREVYGDAERLPVREETPLMPKNPYGVSKAAGELIIGSYGRVQGLKHCMLRLANVYGEGDFGRAVPLFMERCLRGGKLEIYGGRQVLDMVHISDAVDALIKAESLPGIAMNIGSGKGISVRDLALRIKGLTGSGSRVSIRKARTEEVTGFVADISLARKILGWEPKTEFSRGLKRMIGKAKKS